MKSRITLSVVAILTMALALGVNAAGNGRNVNFANQMPAFADMDTNQDAQISTEEFEAFRAERMAQRAEEGRALRNSANSPGFERLDANGDGFVDESEFRNGPCTNMRGGKGYGKGRGMGRSS